VTDDAIVREELELAIESRKELGPELEPEAVEAFVERIERRLAGRDREDTLALIQRREHQKEMILGSMGISVPLFAIAAVFAGLGGIVAVLVALVVITVVSTRQR
jgi:hypothetical protein